MKTDELKTNNKEEVVNGNEKDSEHTISIEFSLEVTGEDEPTKVLRWPLAFIHFRQHFLVSSPYDC